MKRKQKLLSVLMSFCLIFSGLGGMDVFANDEENQEYERVLSSILHDERSVSDELKETRVLLEEEMPDYINYEVAQAQGHVRRLMSEEQSLDSVLFENMDGTRTLYVFNSAVKYIDEEGEVRDKTKEMLDSTKSVGEDGTENKILSNEDHESGTLFNFDFSKSGYIFFANQIKKARFFAGNTNASSRLYATNDYMAKGDTLATYDIAVGTSSESDTARMDSEGIDITESVKGWFDENEPMTSSILMMAETEVSELAEPKGNVAGEKNPVQTVLAVTYAVMLLTSGDYYYFNNNQTGKYLQTTATSLAGTSGYVDEIGSSIKWLVTHVSEGKYVLRPADDQSVCLAVPATLTSSSVGFMTISGTDYSTYCQWEVLPGGQGYGGVRFVNAYNGRVLYSDGTTISTQLDNSTNYSNKVWRSFDITYYGEEYMASRELQTFSMNTLSVDYGEPSLPAVSSKSPSNALWVTPKDFTYSWSSSATWLSFDEDNGGIVSSAKRTTTITATHKATGVQSSFTLRTNNNAIIIIPGIMGSELFAGQNNEYFEYGEPIFQEEKLTEIANELSVPTALDLYNCLKCNADGTSAEPIYVKKFKPSLTTSDDERIYTDNCGFGEQYRTLYNHLTASSDIVARYTVDFFFYDWRLSCSNSANLLNAYINQSGYDKVILICHSMGGLVGSGYLALGVTQQEKVEDVYMLASPLLGTPAVLNVWFNEDISFLEGMLKEFMGDDYNTFTILYGLLTDYSDLLQSLVCNYPSIYELFPTEQYFTLAEENYLTFRTRVIIAGGGEAQDVVCTTYAQTREKLAGYFPRYSATLMSNAEDFHDNCYVNGLHVTSKVPTKYIFNKSASSTATKLIMAEVISGSSYNLTLSVDESASQGVGDSLVPMWSATLNMNSDYGEDFYSYSGSGHMSMDNANVRSFVRNSILGLDTGELLTKEY